MLAFYPRVWVFGLWLLLGGCQSLSLKTSQDKIITIFYFADSHGQWETHNELFWDAQGDARLARAGGFPRLKALVQQWRMKDPDGVILVDGGDTIQGSVWGVVSRGQALIPVLNSLGIDVGIPGNWEVVYGVSALKAVASRLNYPLVASNIIDESTQKHAFPSYLIIERKGIRIAFIGYTDPDVPERQPPSYSKGFKYLKDEVLPDIISDLRSKQKVNAVVLVSHIGLPKAVELSSRLEGVDYHLSADTHERTYEPVQALHPVVEPGAFTSFLGQLQLHFRDGKLVKTDWKLIELTEDKFPQEDPQVKDIIAQQKQKLGAFDQVIGYAQEPLYRYGVNETVLDMILADAIREAAGTEIGLSNGFRFGTPVGPGPIYESDLFMIYPVNMPLRVGRVRGHQLKEFWEREVENVYSQDPRKLFGGWLPRPSGMTLKIDLSKPFGQRVVEIRVGGHAIDWNRWYTIAACEREGDPDNRLCRIQPVADARSLSIDAHQAVKLYFKKHSPLKPLNERRVEVIGMKEPVRSQFYRR